MKGTPTALDVGSYLVEVTAFDGKGGSTSDQFFLDVVPQGATTGNRDPFLALPLFDQFVGQGENVSIVLAGTFRDPDSDFLNYEVSGLPTSLAASIMMLTRSASFPACSNFL